MKITSIAKISFVILSAAAFIGCESHTQEGALIGGVGGAAAGGLIGSKSHGRAGEGALIGGAAGALGGAAVGGQMDKNEKEAADRNARNNNVRGGYYDNRTPDNGYYDRDGYWHQK